MYLYTLITIYDLKNKFRFFEMVKIKLLTINVRTLNNIMYIFYLHRYFNRKWFHVLNIVLFTDKFQYSERNNKLFIKYSI